MEVGVYRNLTHPQNVFEKREKVNMTDDLVKWLRVQSDGYGLKRCGEAADRIEKLEAALKHCIIERDEWLNEARKALEGKDER
jgi:hypothetical protein